MRMRQQLYENTGYGTYTGKMRFYSRLDGLTVSHKKRTDMGMMDWFASINLKYVIM